MSNRKMLNQKPSLDLTLCPITLGDFIEFTIRERRFEGLVVECIGAFYVCETLHGDIYTIEGSSILRLLRKTDMKGLAKGLHNDPSLSDRLSEVLTELRKHSPSDVELKAINLLTRVLIFSIRKN